MRLIDGDKFKEDIKNLWNWDEVDAINASTILKQVMADIDNAPAVSLEKTSFMQGYNYGCDDGKRFYERPQGKWIAREEYDDYPYKTVCECSECGRVIDISHNDFPNFCENCGADMRKGNKV